MKKNSILIAIIGLVLIILSFKPEVTKSVGSLGDVKYSILPPDQFVEQNGKGWVLMDDKIPLTGSDIQNICGITQIPDARGVFIRGLNLKRADGNEDPFQKEMNKERLCGEFQKDALQDHTHKNKPEVHAGAASESDDHIGSGQNGRHNGHLFDWDSQGVQGANVSTETRPKNIALYTYIKINDGKQ